ncbi:MAG: AraC family transcriptional regulator [Burkholderiales bacterium]|nr:AraC family transcriptional regulator [Burkholderiales bacterium]
MDLLTDILQQAGLRRRLLDLRRLSASTALRFPCDKSIGLHVVAQGTVHLHAPKLPAPLALQAGDIAVMARGCVHVLSQHTDPAAVPVEPIGTFSDARALEEGGADAAAQASVVSGAYQLWNAPLHPLFAEMPDWFVLRADELPKLGPLALTVGLLDEEVRHGGLGAETIVHGLLDVVFTYLLREMVSRLGQGGAGWGQAVRDPQVRRAVTLMHTDSAHPWTLGELARRAGLSRTTLAERFRAAMGDTPLNYLRTLRMQKAMRLLGETDRPLESVAVEVGYQDAFSFSKVFKRTVGIAPREFRRQDLAAEDDPWRFKVG